MERLTPERKDKNNSRGRIRRKAGALALAIGLATGGCATAGNEIEPCPEGLTTSAEIDLGRAYDTQDPSSLANPNNIITVLREEYGQRPTNEGPQAAYETEWALDTWGGRDWKEGEDLLCQTNEGKLNLNESGAQLRAEAEKLLVNS